MERQELLKKQYGSDSSKEMKNSCEIKKSRDDTGPDYMKLG